MRKSGRGPITCSTGLPGGPSLTLDTMADGLHRRQAVNYPVSTTQIRQQVMGSNVMMASLIFIPYHQLCDSLSRWQDHWCSCPSWQVIRVLEAIIHHLEFWLFRSIKVGTQQSCEKLPKFVSLKQIDYFNWFLGDAGLARCMRLLLLRLFFDRSFVEAG